jgi:hypothetical protein
MIKEEIKESITSLLTRRNIAVWVDKAMAQIKQERLIIKNAWLKTGVLGVLEGVKGIV